MRVTGGAHEFAERGLHDGRLALHHGNVAARLLDRRHQLPAGEAQKLFQIRAPLRRRMIPRPVRAMASSASAAGASRSRSPSFESLHAERRHGVAEIVQNSLGQFGKAGLERLVDELPAGIRHAFDHAVELARQLGNLILPMNIQPRPEVRAFADRDRTPGHPRQGPEHDAVEGGDQQQQDRDRGADQVQRRIGHGAVTTLGDPARNVDAQAHQRPCRRYP